jgi:hypothetical protein
MRWKRRVAHRRSAPVYLPPTVTRCVGRWRRCGSRGWMAPASRRGRGPIRSWGLLAAVLSAYEAALAERKLLDGPALMGPGRGCAVGAAGAPDALGAAGAPGALGAAGAPGALGAGSVPAARVFLLPGLSLRGVEGRLVRALLDHGATVLTPDRVAGLDAPAGRLWVASSGPGGPLSTLHALDRDGDHESGPRDLHLFAAATPADELREVIRRVMAAGIPWDRVEIVATDSATYGTALDGLARRLGIPATHSAGLPVSRTRVGRAADAYFRWIADGFPVEPIRQLLAKRRPGPAPAGRRGRRRPDGAAGSAPRRGAGPPAPAPPDRLGVRALPSHAGSRAGGRRARRTRRGTGTATRRRARWRGRGSGRSSASLRSLLEPILQATPRPASRHAAWTSRTSPARLADRAAGAAGAGARGRRRWRTRPARSSSSGWSGRGRR